MKNPIKLVLLSLLLGGGLAVVSSVAMAVLAPLPGFRGTGWKHQQNWEFVRYEPPMSEPMLTGRSRYVAPTPPLHDRYHGEYRWTAGTRFGTVGLVMGIPFVPHSMAAGNAARETDDALPWYFNGHPYEDELTSGAYLEILFVATGWPMLSMASDFHRDPNDVTFSSAGREVLIRGIAVGPEDRLWSISLRRSIPTRILWRGFVVNTALFSGVSAIAMIGLPSLLRRMRSDRRRLRGACPGCGYAVDDFDVCPECGLQLQVK